MENFVGVGVIVDAGCFLGKSTAAICSGLLRKNGSWKTRSVIAMDSFVSEDRYIIDSLLGFGIPAYNGYSFLPHFIEVAENFAGLIEVRCGDIMKMGRIDKQIEILSIDFANTRPKSAYAALHWFPKMIPGKSMLIQQDFHSPGRPWLPIMMGALLPVFDLVEPQCDETAVFRLNREIDGRELVAAVQVASDERKGDFELERMIEHLGHRSGALQLTRAARLKRHGREIDARAALTNAFNSGGEALFTKWERWSTWTKTFIEQA